MELDKRLDAYTELVSRYARNSVSLEHAHMVNRDPGDSHYEIAKYKLRGRKIANRMDGHARILAIMMQDNAYREQAKLKTYPTPTTNPVDQLISSPVEADKIAEAAQREADNIMAIAFPSGPEPPVATVNTATTQSAPPTAPFTSTVTTATNRLDHRKQTRPTSPVFVMNTIPDNRPGPMTNPLLIVNTGQDGNTNSFITPTLATNCQNRQGNMNTVAFENTTPESDRQINARLIEIANQGPSLETMATNRQDHHVPDRRQYTNR